jgi:hypothetical protein
VVWFKQAMAIIHFLCIEMSVSDYLSVAPFSTHFTAYQARQASIFPSRSNLYFIIWSPPGDENPSSGVNPVDEGFQSADDSLTLTMYHARSCSTAIMLIFAPSGSVMTLPVCYYDQR